ncbi:MAG: hypothetical protein QME46_08220 [Thermoanaerobacteraceae bacterium]|nr:hypothetical protein [Thermoanaerobacteraceae bacterium]
MAEKDESVPRRNKLLILIPLFIIFVMIGILVYYGFFAKPPNLVWNLLNRIPLINNIIVQPEQNAIEDPIVKRENQLKERETSLNALESQLQQRELELSKKETELEQREIDINNKLDEINNVLKPQFDDIKKLSSLYGKMDPKSAADALSKLNNDNLTAQILKNMGTEQAAAILNNMDPTQAARITGVLAPIQ